MDPFKYREVQALFTARLPDSADSDQLPDRVPLNGYGTLRPNIRGTSVVFTEVGEFAVPRTRQVAFVDGELMVEVVDGESSILQPLFLEVTVDERANQQWSWTLTFDTLEIGERGGEISHPALSFPVEEGDGPLELSTVATTVTRTANFVTRGPRGYRVTEVSAANGELVFAWEDGRTDSIPMPEAVQGVGVAEATQPYEGGLAFDLTDGTSTSSVSLPPGPPGRDGANVLPGRTVVLSEAQQPDFVGIAQPRSPYKSMTLTAISGGGLIARCHADDTPDEGTNYVSYEITHGGRYRLVSTIAEGGAGRGVLHLPDPEDSYGVFPGDVRMTDGLIATTGTWNSSTTWFTTEIGATWEVSITTNAQDARVYMNFFKDTRGGVWQIDLAELPAISSTYSTHSESNDDQNSAHVLTVPEPGTYTLRGTFLGEDPNLPPSSGAARGWLLNNSHNYYLVRVSEPTPQEGALSPGASNKNWAFRVTHPEAGGEEFLPYHGTDVETIMQPAQFFDGATPVNVDALTPGEPISVGRLTMVQHVQCHSSASPDELIDVRTIDTIFPDGTYRAEGRVEVLHDLLSSDQMYTGMLPFNPGELNLTVTAFRNAYPSGPEMATAGTNTHLGDEGLHATSVALVGDDPNIVAAVRFNTPDETRRMSVSDNFGNEWHQPMFIEHRNADLGKVYPRFGYTDGTLVPAGTVWRFSVDYWCGRIPGIRHLIE